MWEVQAIGKGYLWLAFEALPGEGEVLHLLLGERHVCLLLM